MQRTRDLLYVWSERHLLWFQRSPYLCVYRGIYWQRDRVYSRLNIKLYFFIYLLFKYYCNICGYGVWNRFCHVLFLFYVWIFIWIYLLIAFFIIIFFFKYYPTILVAIVSTYVSPLFTLIGVVCIQAENSWGVPYEKYWSVPKRCD